MKPVISISGISKEYTLGSELVAGQSFREMVLSSLISPFRKLRRLRGTDATQTKFWALKDINFSANRGEIVGIIGRNGAGKSTLLKILSRITAPTTGKIEYRGRMASLLEVGTGFHPELTGRENIFLNGAILGLSRKEINLKLDDIVAFAEIEAFLDTPVKRYSSGMYVRLAFSVAAHLEADILVIDEVLAVGDSAFQRKCLGKIQDVASGGRIVFFVSHNTAAVSRLCTRGIWLDEGKVKMDGSIQTVLNAYEASNDQGADNKIASNNKITISAMSLTDDADDTNDTKNHIAPMAACVVEISGSKHIKLSRAEVSIGVYDDAGARLFLINSNNSGFQMQQGLGDFMLRCKIRSLPLTSGRYTINLSVNEGSEQIIGIVRAAVFYVKEEPSNPAAQPEYGPMLVDASWY
ncbi:MAG: ATP-binding cassette domain-containing protein [Arenicella sp.]|nr:ATP-binding cassette domain-containing protein [Arenicella sp.]